MLDEYKKLVKKLIAFKTISADPNSYPECLKTVEFLAKYLTSIGFKTQIFEKYGNPIFFAEYMINPKFETCLIYGHYDVQPASLEDGWKTDPFKLVEKNGKLFGRGIMDDKGQLFVHIITIANLIKQKKLKYNIKFISEGNEEIGSNYIESFIKKHKAILASDFIMISDGEMSAGNPTIELGTRGVINCTLTFISSNNDLHSGLYGGAAPSSVKEAIKFINGLFDENRKLALEGFYNDVLPLDKSVVIPFDLKTYKKNTGTKAILTEKGLDLYQQTGQRPTLEITGFSSGYTGVGYRNSIPAKTTVKFNFRLVNNQVPEKILEQFKKHIGEYMPGYITYKFEAEASTCPVRININNKYVLRAKKVLKEIFRKKVLHRYVGGTEPVIVFFDQILKKPQVLVPFANEDGMMHGMNENFALENIKKQMEFGEKFFSE